MRNASILLSASCRLGVAAFILGSASACQAPEGPRAAADSTTITIRGSGNVVDLAEMWAAAFTETDNALRFDVVGTGTSEGIEDFFEGRADIAMASREMSPEEWSIAWERGLEIRETLVARKGIGVVVNAANPVSSMTFGQLADVFSGTARTWQTFGGPDEPIVIVRKVSGSSPAVFRQKIMGDREFASDAVIVDSKEGVVAEVWSQPWSIGFTGLTESISAQERVRLLLLVNETSDEGGTYALKRPLIFYTLAESSAVAPFLEFVVGKEAQAKVGGMGLYPAQ